MAHVYRLVFVGLVFSIYIFLLTPKTEALSTIFSDSTNASPASNNGHPMVSRQGTASDGSVVTLDATVAKFKVFANSNAPRTISILKACSSSGLDDIPSPGLSPISVKIGGTTLNNSSGCSGENIVFNNVSMNKQDPIYGSLYYATVVATKTGGPGIKNFRISSPGAAGVTFDELPKSVTYDPNPIAQARDAFSIWNASNSQAGNTPGTFSFKFRPTACNYDGVSPVYLKWADADYGEVNETGNDIIWKLFRNGTQIASLSGPALGGNGSSVASKDYSPSKVGVLDIGADYEWRWENVDKNNGIQIFMPFSEISILSQACPPVSVASLDFSCAGANMNISGKIRNVPNQKAWNYKIFFDPPISSLPASSTDGAGNFTQTATGNFTVPRTGKIRVYSGAVGSPQQIPDTSFSSDTPSCGGGPGGGLSDCNMYIKSLSKDNPASAGNAVYRFTVFPRNTFYVASSEPDGKVNDASRGAWKTFTVNPPMYQSGDINTGINYGPDPGGGLYSTGDKKYRFPFPEPAGPDWFIYIEKWDHTKDRDGDGDIDWYYHANGLSQQASCYTAECTVSVDGAFGTGKVKAGEAFQAKITIKNNGMDELPATSRGAFLSATIPSAPFGFQTVPLLSSIGVGVEYTKYVTLTAPNGITTNNLDVYADYYNLRWAGGTRGWETPGSQVSPTCSTSVSTYIRFDITPIARITSAHEEEDPRAISYSTGGDNRGEDGVNLSWDSELFYKRAGAPTTLDGVYTDSSRFLYDEIPRTYNSAGNPLVPDILQAGDEVCARAYFPIAHGWVGPGNDIIDEGDDEAESCPITIADIPYIRAFGADVMAGTDFEVNQVCNPAHSRILGFNSGFVDRTGSGGQYAALAIDEIYDFRSAASKSAGNPAPPKGLSFANTTSPDPKKAGFYQGNPICSTDYFGEKIFPTDSGKVDSTSVATLDLSSAPLMDGGQTVNSGNLTINGTNGFNNHHTIFVNGDVVINSNIKMAGFTNAIDAPSLAVVARGNIYIDKNVKQLDGIYIAQQNGPAGGTIFTCANGRTPYNFANLVANCSDQLVVNGMFASHEVKLLRTAFSLRDSTINEQGTVSCYRPASNARPPGDKNSCASEVFNGAPELYLSPPPFYSQPPNPKIEYYGTRPPIL